MKFQLLIAMGMFLASCAGGQLLGHSEPKSDSSYNPDLYECEREATFAGAGNKQQAFDNCMKARGYKQK
jgi:hypothetical protein